MRFPAEDGYYWMKTKDGPAQVVRVRTPRLDKGPRYAMNTAGIRTTEEAATEHLFAGPIQPPHEDHFA